VDNSGQYVVDAGFFHAVLLVLSVSDAFTVHSSVMLV